MDVLSLPVLVLNKHWTAMRVISAARAVSLVFKGIAEVIDVEEGRTFLNYDFSSWRELSEFHAELDPRKYEWITCVHGMLAVPAVIRLLKFDKMKRVRIRFTRRTIYARDNRTCQYCGKQFTTSDLNLDHVVPRSRGGTSSWENIVCSCIPCNTRKGPRTPAEAGMRLIRQPQRPVLLSELAMEPRQEWKHFVDEAYWNVELRE